MDVNKVNNLLLIIKGIDEESINIQRELECGMINRVDAIKSIELKAEKKIKTQRMLVEEVHVTKNGKPRTISFNENKRLWHTKLENGKQVYGKTEEALFLNLYDYYFGINSSITVDRAFKTIIQKMEKDVKIAEATSVRYKQDYYFAMTDDFAIRKVASICQDDIEDFFNEIAPRMRFKRLKSMQTILNKIFAFCYKEKIISNDPMYNFNLKKYAKSCISGCKELGQEILSCAEIELVRNEAINCIHSNRNKGYLANGFITRMAIATGARVGELCALEWTDISEKSIHFHRQQLKNRSTGEYYTISTLKEEIYVSKGGRYFPITPEIRELLEEIKMKQKELNIQTQYVFAKKDGSWVLSETYEHWLNELFKKMDIKATGNHVFRKSLNSNVLIPAGMNEVDRAKLLGHSVGTNLKHYSYSQDDVVNRTAEQITNYHEKHSHT